VAQIVKSSDFVLGPSHSDLGAGLLVLVIKGVVAIDPLVSAMGPGQLNDGTQSTSPMILKCED
jgi:hypothetical protein